MTNVVSLPVPVNTSVQLRTIEEFLEQRFLHKRDLVIGGTIISGGKVIVGAQKGKGKTIFLFQLACELASGDPFLGLFDVPEPKKVGIFQKEVVDWALQERLQQTITRYSRLNPDNLLIPNVEDIIDLRLDTNKGIQMLYRTIETYELDVVMLDPIISYHGFDEDKSNLVQKVLEPINTAATRYGTTFVISHHFKKQSRDFKGNLIDQGPQDFRGSGRWYDWCDSAFWFNDRGHDKVVMGSFLRNGAEQLPDVILTLDRKYAAFQTPAEIQGEATTAAEFSAIQILSQEPGYECLYTDFISKISDKLKLSKGQAKTKAERAISALRAKNNVYFIGSNGDRVVRMLTPRSRAWAR